MNIYTIIWYLTEKARENCRMYQTSIVMQNDRACIKGERDELTSTDAFISILFIPLNSFHVIIQLLYSSCTGPFLGFYTYIFLDYYTATCI